MQMVAPAMPTILEEDGYFNHVRSLYQPTPINPTRSFVIVAACDLLPSCVMSSQHCMNLKPYCDNMAINCACGFRKKRMAA
ncbi:hypothetical protein ACTXT7_012262 [Hymenolepis weldensis]